MTQLIDCHTHTYLSGHGIGTVDEIVAAAVEKGLATIALTEHLALPSFMDSNREVSMDPADLAGYCDQIEAAREKYPQIEIVTGMEVDWIEGNTEYSAADLRDVTFLLGSVHFIDGWPFDSPNELDEWERRQVDEVWMNYFSLWKDAVRSEIPYDVMAHPDLPKKFGHFPSFDLKDSYADLARCAAEKGVAIEVNTAGLRKPVGELYPSHEMLKGFHDAGVDSCVGSDAHAPSEVGYGLEYAYQALREAGYERILCPTQDGKKRYISL